MGYFIGYVSAFIRCLFLITVLCAVAAGCAGRQEKPAVLPENLPADWAVLSASDDAGANKPPLPLASRRQIKAADLPMTASLLDLLDDPTVTALVEEALANNPNLKATAARLKASGFLLSQTGGRRLPEVALGADRGRNNQSVDETGEPLAQNAYGVSANISWELDIWGKISNLHQAQELAHEALGLEYLRAYDALAARVIQAWISALAAARTLEIEKERLTALLNIETSLLNRYREGLGDLKDYSAARTRTEVARSNVSARTETHHRALRTLEILAGRYPKAGQFLHGDLPDIRTAPVVPPDAALKNRPDIRAALARINAGHLNALAAHKDRLPALRLIASVSKSGAALSELDTASRIWNLAAGLAQPVFRGGRLKDRAMAREAEAQALVYTLAQKVLSAIKEVEDALEKETALARQETALATATQEAEKTTAYFRTRYRNGLDNIQTLLTAQEQEMNIKTSLTDIKAARMANRIDMALALGLGAQPKKTDR